jgi:hypothetical protein
MTAKYYLRIANIKESWNENIFQYVLFVSVDFSIYYSEVTIYLLIQKFN